MQSPQNLSQKIGSAFAQSEQAASEGTQTLREGLKLLEGESAALKAAKDEAAKKAALDKSPLKDKNFQEKLKKAIAACEASAKSSEETAHAAAAAKTQWEDLEKMIETPVAEYSDALLLDRRIPTPKTICAPRSPLRPPRKRRLPTSKEYPKNPRPRSQK